MIKSLLKYWQDYFIVLCQDYAIQVAQLVEQPGYKRLTVFWGGPRFESWPDSCIFLIMYFFKRAANWDIPIIFLWYTVLQMFKIFLFLIMIKKISTQNVIIGIARSSEIQLLSFGGLHFRLFIWDGQAMGVVKQCAYHTNNVQL